MFTVSTEVEVSWRWLLVEKCSGVPLADHQVELDPGAAETEAFEVLYRFLRWRADPDRRVASEAELVGRVGAWIGSHVLGEQIGQAMVSAAPLTVRVQVPHGAEFLAFRPFEPKPYLERQDTLAALEFAAAAVQKRELPLARPA